jgi:hypothetical protein
VPFGTPLGAKTPGAGQVVSLGLMAASIRNGLFLNALSNAGVTVASWQRAGSGGEVRFTSFCFRQVYRVPAWLTCRVWLRGAFRRPSTPSQPP